MLPVWEKDRPSALEAKNSRCKLHKCNWAKYTAAKHRRPKSKQDLRYWTTGQ